MVKLGDRINLIHRRAGIATVIVFLATGVYLEVRFPDLYGSNEAIRYLFRANHVYILLSGLLNIGIGTYLGWHTQRWRKNLQVTGSVFLLSAPILLIVAFFYEPPFASPERYITVVGIVFLAVGTLCHMASGPLNRT